jgi:hypothetical protein
LVRHLNDAPEWRTPNRIRAGLARNATFCFFLILLSVLTSVEVRSNLYYIVLYELLAALWLAVGLWLCPFFGISLEDDVLDRRNPAALWTVHGSLLGLAACFAGANIGSGPGPWAVIFSGVLASAGFFLVWIIANGAGAHWADSITIDRNEGSGMRLGALLAAAGLSSGSAVTGDWVSASATIRECLLRSWPIAPALCLALFAERSQRHSNSWRWVAAYPAITVLCMAVERHFR